MPSFQPRHRNAARDIAPRARRAALPAYIGKVDVKVLLFLEQLACFHAERLGLDAGRAMLVKQLPYAVERVGRVHVYALDHSGFSRVRLGNDQCLDAALACQDRDRQHAGHGPQQPVEPELADQQDFTESLDLHRA